MTKKQVITALILFISGAVILVSCGRRNEAIPEPTIQYALDIALARRESIVRPGRNEVIDAVKGRCYRWILDGHANVFSQVPLADVITVEDALYDAQTLLVALRHMYGPYIYFGGDVAFVPLFEDIKQTLSSRDYWHVDDFSDIVRGKLITVATDNHIFININGQLEYFQSQDFQSESDAVNYFYTLGTMYPSPVSAGFYMSDIQFERTSNGFRNSERNINVSDAVGHNIHDIFRLAVDEYGMLFYIPVVVLPGHGHDSVYALRLIYAETEEVLYLTRHIPEFQSHQPWELKWIGDIPVVTMRDFVIRDLDYVKRQLSFAESVHDAPILIIDARSTLGGMAGLPEGWMNALVGERVHQQFVSLTVNVKPLGLTAVLGERFQELADTWTSNLDAIEILDYHEVVPFALDHSVQYLNVADNIIEREQLLILLTDRFANSAGETFLDLVFALSNSLIIGQNTSGTIVASATLIPMTLPRSGVIFGFGPTLFIHPESHFAEGIGFAPDIWAVGDALESTFAMLRREGLICDENRLIS